MDIEYEIGLEDLVRLHRACAERAVGMSLWLLLVCGMILGPIGALSLAFLLDKWLYTHHLDVSGSDLVVLVFGVGFVGFFLASVYHASWNVRRRLRRRIREQPELVGKRSLYLQANSLFESTPSALNHYVGAEDKQAFLRQHMFHFWKWLELHSVKEDNKYILLFAKSGDAILVPIAGMPPAEVQAFRDALMSYWHSAKSGQPLPSKEDVWPPSPTSEQVEQPK